MSNALGISAAMAVTTGVDEVEDDVECARQDEREEEAEAGQVCVALGTMTRGRSGRVVMRTR